jgi:eukaryotic-like serine/threonine-protein kinase
MRWARRVRDPLGLRGRTLLERYVVEDAIARGGMAVIYRGRDARLARPVCIKVFHRLAATALGHRAAYQHFVQEAFALSQFSHPHTLRIYDFGYADEEHLTPFQISEWLDGGTLTQRIAQGGPMALDETLEVLEPIAGALAEAHARGIIHRDIKPSNILFGSAGHFRIVKLCDFGIAELTAAAVDARHRAEDTLTPSGQRLRLYSPGWAAPEQLRGDPCGPASDVFALGLVVCFAMTGQAIFPSALDTGAIAMRRESDSHIDRFLEGVALPPRIAVVVRRACREAIDERFGSADDFAAAMRAAARSMPRGSSPPPVAGRPMKVVPINGGEQIDLGGEGVLPSPARFRITIQPSRAGTPRLHIRGLNCFVALVEDGQRTRPTTAVDVDGDAVVEFLAADRRVIDGVRCHVRADAVLIDPGPDRALTVLTPRR